MFIDQFQEVMCINALICTLNLVISLQNVFLHSVNRLSCVITVEFHLETAANDCVY